MEGEFSFPSIPEHHDARSRSFAYSPPPFPSSSASHRSQRRRSFSSMEDLTRPGGKILTEAAKDEERMDMLWEDFNDENLPGEGKSGGAKWGETGDLFCAGAVPRRRPGLAMILKVLKTLLLVQKIKRRRNL